MPVPIATVDYNGINTPLFTDVLDYLQEQYRAIYGADVNLDPDTQDGQWLAITALAIHDANQTVAAAYQAYSPAYAQGVGLSSVVKINGIRRLRASVSSVVLTCVGIAGRQIGDSVVGDSLSLGTQWLLPLDVVIPPEGQIEVTATCLEFGSITAEIDTITEILTPVPGWQTVTNPVAASIGLPLETDAALRRRQMQSTANPSQTVILGIQGAIENLEGVQRVMIYENPYSTTDINGIPPYAMAIVVQGGDSQDIANAVALRKTPGSPTFGTASVQVIDRRGIPSLIKYFVLTLVPIDVHITVKALPGFSATIEELMVLQVIEFLRTLPIGYNSFYNKLVAATQLPEPDGLTYTVTVVQQKRGATAFAAADVNITYIEAATADLTNVTVTIDPTPGLP